MTELAAAVATLRSQPYGFFSTVTSGGGPCVRLVQALRIDDDATVWFVTSPSTRKAGEIVDGDGAAAYAVEERESFAYACVRGRATLLRDAALASQLWDPGLDAFFAEGPGGDDVVVVRLRARVVEFMSFAAAVHPDPYGLRAATISVCVH